MNAVQEMSDAPEPQTASKRRAGARELDLDVVRGGAILLAMGWHINQPTNIPVVDFLLAPGHTLGWAGVDLFFVLSGFLVGRIVFKEELAYGSFDFGRFFKRRAFKLWPVLYTFLAALVVLTRDPWSGYLWQIGLHVANFFPPSQAVHLWSLAVEEHFYLALGTLVPIYIKRAPTWTLWRWLTAVIVLALVLRSAGYFLGATAEQLQWQTQYRMDGLASGVLLALISLHRPALMQSLLRKRPLWALLSLLGATFLWFNDKASAIGCTVGFSVSWMTAISVLLLVYKSGIERRAPHLCKTVAFFGFYSYALYIWHVPALRMVPAVLGKFGVHNPVVTIILDYVAATALAVVVTRIIERPSLALRDRLFPARVTAV
jgi:peptidoglycan/LPS O-acetylase OafA/YrhL